MHCYTWQKVGSLRSGWLRPRESINGLSMEWLCCNNKLSQAHSVSLCSTLHHLMTSQESPHQISKRYQCHAFTLPSVWNYGQLNVYCLQITHCRVFCYSNTIQIKTMSYLDILSWFTNTLHLGQPPVHLSMSFHLEWALTFVRSYSTLDAENCFSFCSCFWL